MFWITAYFQATLVVLRLIFNLLNFMPAAVCIYYSSPVENCEVNNTSHNILGKQEVSETVNAIGTLLEDANSLLLITAVFSWKIFSVKEYFCAIPRVGHFWVWCLFCVTNTLSILYVDIVHGKDNETKKLTVQAVALISEMFLQTVLASALNFIRYETYVDWVENRFRYEFATQQVFKALFRIVLCSYVFRNLGFFLYDTALVSLSISLVKGGAVEGSRDWDSLLLLLTAAFRGSFTKFFFQKIFQGQELPQVCEKEEVARPLLGYAIQWERLGGYKVIEASTERSVT